MGVVVVDDDIEREVLLEFARRMLMENEELVHFLEGKVNNPQSVASEVAKSLSSRDLIIYVSPIGQSCLAITQKGIRQAKSWE
jgi:hypothetical protein